MSVLGALQGRRRRSGRMGVRRTAPARPACLSAAKAARVPGRVPLAPSGCAYPRSGRTCRVSFALVTGGVVMPYKPSHSRRALCQARREPQVVARHDQGSQRRMGQCAAATRRASAISRQSGVIALARGPTTAGKRCLILTPYGAGAATYMASPRPSLDKQMKGTRTAVRNRRSKRSKEFS